MNFGHVSIATRVAMEVYTCDFFFIRMVLNANGAQGVCIPFSQFPLDQAIPQIVSLPSQQVLRPGSWHFNGKPFFVAYGCMPLTLVADIQELYEHKVLLFVKDTLLVSWARPCCHLHDYLPLFNAIWQRGNDILPVLKSSWLHMKVSIVNSLKASCWLVNGIKFGNKHRYVTCRVSKTDHTFLSYIKLERFQRRFMHIIM